MEQDSEERLIELAKRGDQSAFGALIDKYVKLAGAIAFSAVGDFHEAADIVQEAFIKAHFSLGALHETSKFKSWLYGIVRTTAVDHLRRRKFRTVSLDEVADPGGAAAGKESVLPFTRMETAETSDRVLKAVAELPEQYREAVVLKHVENLSYREIARLTGATESAVESRLFRARQMLKEKLKDLE